MKTYLKMRPTTFLPILVGTLILNPDLLDERLDELLGVGVDPPGWGKTPSCILA